MATLTPARPPVLNLANQLTLGRFVLAIVLFVLIALGHWVTCMVVFALAAFTDWLDGYLARKHNLSSSLGRILDPLVDKVLTCGVYISLLPKGTAEGWLLPWMVTVVVARELVITSLRSYVEQYGTRFGADWLGKFKMVLQCAAVFGIFVPLIFHDHDLPTLEHWFGCIRDGLIYAMIAATVLSGLQYLWKAAVILKGESGSGLRS